MNDASLTRENRLLMIQNYISRMPSLSTTVTKVLEICNSPATSPNDLNRVISLDPVLTAQILKLINSAYYNLPNQVTSLARAIIMLGINTVKNLVLSTAVLKNLENTNPVQSLDMEEFWTHSIGVGAMSKLIAAKIGVPVINREEYFVAGLLHDLGKIPLNNRFPEEYGVIPAAAEAEEVALYEAENVILKVNHCMAGDLIAEKWKLGAAIHDSIVFHHAPEEADEKHNQLASVAALANNYAYAVGIGSAGDSSIDEDLTLDLVDKFNLDWDELVALRETVLAEIEKAKVFLEVKKRKV